MNRAYRYRIYPNSSQQEMFAKTFGCVRFIYNKMLTDRIAHYHETGKVINPTPASYKHEYPWLREVDSLALVNAQMNLRAAFSNYQKNKSFGFPKYHSRKKTQKAYTTNYVKGNISIIGKHLKLPKVGLIRIKLHRQIPNTHRIKSVTVCLEPDGKYYASILTEYDLNIPEYHIDPKRAIGLDYSSPHFYVDSEGRMADIPHFYRDAEAALARAQRRMSKMVHGSSNYEKQRRMVAKLHSKIRNQRRDWLHKESKRIANEWDVVCIEDVNLQLISQRYNLAKATYDNGFAQFRTFLSYKLAEHGKRLIMIDKWCPSTKKCNCCGVVNSDICLDDREWVCPACQTKHDRDLNAAINIRNAGLLLL